MFNLFYSDRLWVLHDAVGPTSLNNSTDKVKCDYRFFKKRELFPAPHRSAHVQAEWINAEFLSYFGFVEELSEAASRVLVRVRRHLQDELHDDGLVRHLLH